MVNIWLLVICYSLLITNNVQLVLLVDLLFRYDIIDFFNHFVKNL